MEKFCEVVDSCKGTVELISKEGDRLNLKSKLSQYVALSKIFGDNELRKEIEVVCHDPDDTQRMLEFLVTGK